MPMVGIVVVSHSRRLAQAAVDLALEMVVGEKPPITIAAGAGESASGVDIIGTDATRIVSAIDEVASQQGVLVIMDLGSAILSAELALELRDDDSTPVRLSSAPFFEGLQAAVVVAASGATLDEVEREAGASLGAKISQLGDERSSSAVNVGPQDSTTAPDATADLVLVNQDGLHARPAAAVVAAIAGFDARVTMSNLRTGAGPVSAGSPIGLATLAARASDTVRVEARGPDAADALNALRTLITDGFGERPAARTAEHLAPVSRRNETPATHPIGVSPGRTVGPALVVVTTVEEPTGGTALSETERPVAVQRAEEAASSVASDLHNLSSRAAGSARDVVLAIESVARDTELLASIRSQITEHGVSPERAVWDAIAKISEVYAAGGPLLAARVVDLHAVRDRMIAALTGKPAPGIPASDTPYVLVAVDLAPTDTAVLDPAICLAIVTEEGGPTSHTAILARTLGIPAVVSAQGMTSIENGTILLVDGTTGEVIVNPSTELVNAQRQDAATRTAQGGTTSGPGATADGHPIPLLANIASADDVAAAVEAGSEGVGLFRTEFLFLGREDAPGLDEQASAYRAVLDGFPGQKVVIRTLDAGADKPLPFVTAAEEPNPALGVRGYRTSVRHPELLETQLAAIAAAADGTAAEVWVMAPMIATPDEAADFVALCRAHSLDQVGVMIETPAAALMAGEVLTEVDFVSLGTNDLTQYTMAADRTLGDLATFNDPWQPSVLHLIRTVCDAGTSLSKPVGVCGEAGADPILAAVLTGLGVTSLSMTPRSRPAVVASLKSFTMRACQAAATAACAARTSTDARSAALALLRAPADNSVS